MSLVENVASKDQAFRRPETDVASAGFMRIGAIVTNAYLPLLLGVGVYLGAAFMLPLVGLKAPPAEKAQVIYLMIWVFSGFALVTSLIVNVAIAAVRALGSRKGGIVDEVLREFRAFGFWRRLLMMTIVSLISALTMVAALGFKTNISAVNPFSWDPTWMQLDRLIHLGTDPWRLLHPLLGHDAVTKFIDFMYQKVWFFLLIGGWMLFALRMSMDAVQVRYLVSMMLAWIIGGNLMATVFSSGGPVYFAGLGFEPDIYAPLKAYLQEVHGRVMLDSVVMQQNLWIQYVQGTNAFGGISAFPSMHNAIAALLAIVAWNLNRIFGVIMWGFAAIILVGSIHLGWHYAVDSYAGILVAVLAWRMSRPVAEWILQRKAAQQLAAMIR